MTRPAALRLRFWLYHLGLVVIVCASVGRVRAQSDVLPITIVGEATFSEVDAAAILHVLDWRAERAGISIERMAMKYSAVFKRDEIPARIFDAMRNHPAKFAAIVATIDRFRRGTLPNPCRGARHWGAPSGIDMVRARRAGWRRLQCGTKNAFWAFPARR